MQNNNSNNYLQEDEIDLKEIFKLLINSKKLIIIITLVITTLGAIYVFQKAPEYKSTALIEIGNYGQDGQTLIEPTEALIQELAINFIHRQKALNINFGNLVFKSIEEVDRLIQIGSTSTSSVESKKILIEVVRYIENRHSLLLSNNLQKTEKQLLYKIKNLNDQIEYINNTLSTQNEREKLRIANEIESLNDQIEYINNTLLTQNEREKLRISNQIRDLNIELPSIDLKIKTLNEIIVADQDNLLLLKSNADLFIQRASRVPTLDEIIFSYKTRLIDYENEKITLSQKKYNLEIQLKLLETNNVESDEIFNLSQEKDSLEIQLKLLETNNVESDEIFHLSQEFDGKDLKKDDLEFELELLKNQNPTSTQLIGEIVTRPVDLKKGLIILLSFLSGLFLSFVIVFINVNLIKFKENKS